MALESAGPEVEVGQELDESGKLRQNYVELGILCV